MGDAALAIVVLLAITALAVYKPWGRTRYGRRKQQQEMCAVLAKTQVPTPVVIGTPETKPGDGLALSLKVFLLIAAIIALIFIVSHLAGGGLGRHSH